MFVWTAVSARAPQGSVLDPLPFALYANDQLASYCLLDLYLYADNAELHCSDSDLQMVENFLQSDLISVATRLGSSHLYA